MKVDYVKREEELEERCKNIPEVPEAFYEWAKSKFKTSWMFYHRHGNYADMFCCACGAQYEVKTKRGEFFEAEFEHIVKPVHNKYGACEKCGAAVQYKTGLKKNLYSETEHFYIGQKYKERGFVLRYFRLRKSYGPNLVNDYGIMEVGRCFYEEGKKRAQEDWQKYDYWAGRDFWDCVNISGMNPITMEAGYIYPDTYENLKGTVMEYSCLREWVGNNTYALPRYYMNAYFRYPIMEMLFKKDAENLVRELEMSNGKGNPLNINTRAKTPYDMLRITKKRLKTALEMDSEVVLAWLQYERKTKPVKDEVICFFKGWGISPQKVGMMLNHMTPEQALNYIQKQAGQYNWSAYTVANQYEDYMLMCEKLGKNLGDEMIYRPRELKKRHDQAVLEIEMQKAALQADEYSKKYADAEKVLGKIKTKLEYASGEYFIQVPQRIVDIVLEGRALHHCVGSTDRYFDRIKHKETYICFLRKAAEPETPFYTIEVEPGGTIRQHRGMYDEEPELDKVKPFLIEWQQEIKKRMSEKDKKLAAVSAELREKNIEDLKAKNNTRVLEGLMEDLMEAI